MTQTADPNADPAAIARALLQTAHPLHHMRIAPEDEAEVVANLELAVKMLNQLARVQLSDDHIDLAPVFFVTAPEEA